MRVIEHDEHFDPDQVFTCPCFFDTVFFLLLAKQTEITCDIGILKLIKKRICIKYFALDSGKKFLFCVY